MLFDDEVDKSGLLKEPNLKLIDVDVNGVLRSITLDLSPLGEATNNHSYKARLALLCEEPYAGGVLSSLQALLPHKAPL